MGVVASISTYHRIDSNGVSLRKYRICANCKIANAAINSAQQILPTVVLFIPGKENRYTPVRIKQATMVKPARIILISVMGVVYPPNQIYSLHEFREKLLFVLHLRIVYSDCIHRAGRSAVLNGMQIPLDDIFDLGSK